MITVNGVNHEVSIVVAHYSDAYGTGELKADCVCGWWDTRTFQHDVVTEHRAAAEDYARLKLQFAAADHLPKERAA